MAKLSGTKNPGGTKNSDHYQKLQERYGAALPGRITEIEQLWQQIIASAAYIELAQELRRHVHSVAGSAGTFGFSQMSEVAREFDALLYCCLNQDSDLKAEIQSITDLLHKMRLLADSGPDLPAPPARAS